MKDPSKIEFDEDILLFEVSLMKKTQKVSDAGWIIFNLLHLVQEKYENTFMQTFEILNCFLFYGKEILAPNLPMIETVIEMAQKCIFAKYQKRNSERENSEAALIFQQILQTFQGLVDNYLTIILSCTLQRLNTAIKHDYFRTRLLGVILSAFAYNTELTISILLNMQSQMGDSSLDNTLKQIFINVQNFKQTYDKKIAIQGLCYLLVYQNLPDNMVISYSHLFKILIQILSDDKSNLSKMAVEPAKQLKKLRTEETEANLVYRNMKTPLEEFDEFTHFREAIRLIQSSNPLKFPSLVGQLDQQQAEQLQTIIKSKRVVISSHKNPMTTTRAIVRPKYKK